MQKNAVYGVMPETQITCACCKGTGKTELEPVLQEVLDVCSKRPKFTGEILGLIGHRWLKRTALNNRLNRLLALGLVACEKRGKQKYWSRK